MDEGSGKGSPIQKKRIGAHHCIQENKNSIYFNSNLLLKYNTILLIIHMYCFELSNKIVIKYIKISGSGKG